MSGRLANSTHDLCIEGLRHICGFSCGSLFPVVVDAVGFEYAAQAYDGVCAA